jgi:hypothetical protein
MSAVSRRDVLRGGLGLTGVLALGSRVVATPRAYATDDGVNVRSVWQPITSVAIPRPDALHPTLIPAGHFTPSTARDAWHLYVWSHGKGDGDPTDFRLFSAPSPEGPYTDEGLLLEGCLTPVPSGYKDFHFDSGDIVWDAANSRYVSSPHALRASWDPTVVGENPQDSFLIQSTDGINWSWLDGDNSVRLRCGPPGTADEVHTGYGRLLRDLDGVLTKWNGYYWWLYRAQRHGPRSIATGVDPVNTRNIAPTVYRPWIAKAGALSSSWAKAADQAFIALPQPDVGAIGMGAFVKAADKFWVQYACGTDGTGLAAAQWLLGGADSADAGLLTAKQQPTPLAPYPSTDDVANDALSAAKMGAGNIIRDPVSRTQYLVAVSTGTESAGIPARATIYQSVV